MSLPIVTVSNLSFSYPDGTRALHDLSFSMQNGERVAIVGCNGAGKSTLLLHLNGCLLASEGVVQINDIVVTRKSATLAQQMVGMIFQDPDDQLFMSTVAEDVAFGPLNMGLPSPEVEARVNAALAKVGMAHLAERPPYRLSAGEKRAVAIATVLSMEPNLLVMDEPSSFLDPRARRRLIELLQAFDKSTIIATHDLPLVAETCNRVLVMEAGRIAADGPMREILSDTKLMRAHGLELPSGFKFDQA